MPNLDRTGPEGKGSGTGQKQGTCFNGESTRSEQRSTNTQRPFGQGRGRGRGAGVGQGRRAGNR